ncbi:hypothetical protein HY411_02320 [Candidatus Gottesmanbacteria bacterium]|nr:hypothetical protein [Candidatus Gottesmanbacteria bacterium]
MVQRKILPRALNVLVFFYFVFLLSPAIKGELGGTFASRALPKEYTDLKDFIHTKPEFFRTLWVPKQQKFNFYSYAHPAISADTLLGATSSAQLLSLLADQSSREVLGALGVRYVIIPNDPYGDIFVEDHKYSDHERERFLKVVDGIPWLARNGTFPTIAVYETHTWNDRFSLVDPTGTNSSRYTMIKPSHYQLSVTVASPTILVFAENYSPYWQAKIGNNLISSQKYQYGLNSFALSKIGTYNVDVTFSQEMVYTYARYISLAVIVSVVGMIVWKKPYEP